MPIIALELETRLPVDNLTSGLRSTIDDATRLSQLGVSLLPVALIIQYSSQSIMAARSIVQGSRVYQKADLLNGYSTLLDSTNELYDLLDDFDNEFESLYIFGNTI
jgi:pyridoxal biosynthesis lyase PdxS